MAFTGVTLNNVPRPELNSPSWGGNSTQPGYGQAFGEANSNPTIGSLSNLYQSDPQAFGQYLQANPSQMENKPGMFGGMDFAKQANYSPGAFGSSGFNQGQYDDINSYRSQVEGLDYANLNQGEKMALNEGYNNLGGTGDLLGGNAFGNTGLSTNQDTGMFGGMGLDQIGAGVGIFKDFYSMFNANKGMGLAEQQLGMQKQAFQDNKANRDRVVNASRQAFA